MKKSFLIIFILTVFCISSCDVFKRENLRSFVWAYYEADGVHAYERSDGNIALSYTDTKIVCDWKSKKQQKELYDSLCYAHNDMTYNKTILYFISPDAIDAAELSVNDIVSINVVSNTDFDEQHPAWTSLNDIIRFVGISVSEYLQSNYTYQYYWDDKQDSLIVGYPYHSPVNKLLSEMTAEDFRFLTPVIGVLHFEKEPTVSKKHGLTITIKFDNGKVIVAHSMVGDSKKSTITKVFE